MNLETDKTDSLKKKTSRQCPKNENRVHVTVDGCRSRRRRPKPRLGRDLRLPPFMYLFLPCSEYRSPHWCSYGSFFFFFVVHRHPIFDERHHRSASTAMVPLGCLHFLHIMNVVWSQTCTRNRTVFGTATAHHGAATTGEKESVKLLFWRCPNERLGLASASKNMERSRRIHFI